VGKSGSILVMDAGQGMGYVRSSRRSAGNWRLNKSDIVLSAQIFRVMHWKLLMSATEKNMD